jgi:rhomboid protease GluP
MFTRTESFRSFLKLYPTISVIVGIHILLWAIMYVPLPGGRFIFVQTVGYNTLIAEGEYWRLITPIFVHVGFSHMLFNSFSLILFGPALERMLGKTKFIISYLGTGIIANFATYKIEPLEYSHLGASGAIFGLFGIYLYLVLMRKELIDQANSQIIITILVIGLIMTFINQNINVVAHIFGFIGGLLVGPVIFKNHRKRFV